MIQFIIQFKNFKKIQFKKIFNSKICKKIQFKKIFNSKICNSKKYSIQKFAKKFNSKFDSKCWIWQDSIQQYIHSITNYGYCSPLASTLACKRTPLPWSCQRDRSISRIGTRAGSAHQLRRITGLWFGTLRINASQKIEH